MSRRTEEGIADDAADYESFGDPAPEPPPSDRPSKKNDSAHAGDGGGGISEDAGLYEDLVEQGSEDPMSLDSSWLFKLHDQVFGPVTAKALLEKLYSGEVNAETQIAPEDGEFMALRRYGGYRAHLEKAKVHLEALADVRKKEQEEKRRRVKRTVMIACVATAFAAAGFLGIGYAIRTHRQNEAKRIAAEEEQKLRGELEQLGATVMLEPPLIDVLDDEPGQGAQPGKARRRKKASGPAGPAVYTGPPGAELTRGEIVAGVESVFPGLKRCLVEQMKADPESVPERIVLSFNINNDGVVQNTDLDDRILKKSPLKPCLSGLLATVKFRKFNGEVRNVEYPITIGRR